MAQTTPSEFVQALSVIKDRGRFENDIWVYSTYALSNDIVSLGSGSSMVGYSIKDTISNSVATMNWEDIVSDPDNLIALIIT